MLQIRDRTSQGVYQACELQPEFYRYVRRMLRDDLEYMARYFRVSIHDLRG